MKSKLIDLTIWYILLMIFAFAANMIAINRLLLTINNQKVTIKKYEEKVNIYKDVIERYRIKEE